MFIAGAFFVLMFAIDWSLYFRHAGHFFQADSIFLLDHRATSITEFLRRFAELHPSGWYRPLSHTLIVSVLYPIARLNPLPYQIFTYAEFLAVTIALYALALAITRRHLFAAVAVAFFSIHSSNAYTTYDVTFVPELQYALFYIAAVLAYLTYVRRGTKLPYALSLICFVLALLSKEAAITLPAMLILSHLLPGSNTKALRATAAHVAIAIVYVAFVGGYLHVEGFSIHKLLNPPANANGGTYHFAADHTLLKNGDLALTEAFNIPRGWWGQWRGITPYSLMFLKLFRVFVAAIAALLLLRADRKVILFGIAWFLVTVIPALPLVDHFIPYYLFLPVVGWSFVVAAVLVWTYDRLQQVQPVLAASFIALIFAATLYATSPGTRRDIADNRLLGGSSRLALNSLREIQRLYPSLPPNTNVYFEDANQSLHWELSWGGLLRMAYGRDDIGAQFASEDDPLIDELQQKAIVFEVRDGHILDRTSDYRADPIRFIHYKESPIYHLELSESEVIAGHDSYTLSVTGVHDIPVRVNYTIDDGPIQNFTVQLDSSGRVVFHVSAETKRGRYKFLGFQVSNQTDWIRSGNSLVVY